MSKIYLVRDQKVMLDSDLAELYGVKTKVALNEKVNNLSLINYLDQISLIN